jgi:DNA polymerase-3 subunit delta
MAVIDREELRNRIKRHEFAPVYLLFGSEPYLRDLAAKTIADRAFSENDFRDFNDTNFSLNTADNLGSALGAARQLPMMSARRVVRITDVRISATGFRDTVKEDHENVLSDYLANPAEQSIVIFIADELNGNRKMSKLLKEKALAVEFDNLKEPELLRMTRTKLNEAAVTADDLTIRHIIQLVGPDLRRLMTELDKLITASMPEKIISREMADDLVAYSRVEENWGLTDNLISGRRGHALELLRKLMDDGSEPLALLGLLGSNFRRLMIAKTLMGKGVGRSEVIRVAKPPFNSQEDFFSYARRTEMRSFARALQRMAETDMAIKTSLGGGGPAGARMQLEMLVCELALL